MIHEVLSPVKTGFLIGHYWCTLTGCKQTIELQSHKSSSWYFHHHFPRMADNLAYLIDELTTEGISVDGY